MILILVLLLMEPISEGQRVLHGFIWNLDFFIVVHFLGVFLSKIDLSDD